MHSRVIRESSRFPLLNKETSMRCVPGLALLAVLFPAALMAVTDSQTFYLATPARAGNVELPRGICEVTWTAASGSRVRLTFKTEDEKTLMVPARMVTGKQDRTGVVTSVVNGVTYLQVLYTNNAKFIFQNGIDAPK
jgi:hypothetical protein